MEFNKKIERDGNSPFLPYNAYEDNDYILKKNRREIILPGVSPTEESRLVHSITRALSSENRDIDNVPQHYLNDIYTMYYNDKISRMPVDKKNRIKQKVIDKVYNSLTKSLTKNSALFSTVITKELVLYLHNLDNSLKEDGYTNGLDEEDGDSDETKGNDLDSSLEKAFKDGEKELKKAIDLAEKEIKEMSELMGGDSSCKLDLNENPTFIEDFARLKNVLRKVQINKESLKSSLKKVLNRSSNHFSQKSISIEESILESEEIEELLGLEYLSHVFKGLGIFDIDNESRLFVGKMDLYLDCSGSMSTKGKFGGITLTRLEFVKMIAILLYKLNMIDKLYFFDDEVNQVKNINEFTILSVCEQGGTNFNRVVDQCIKNKRNSLIITDGEDSCLKYAKNVFWAGIGGTMFANKDAFNTYKALKQCVSHDESTSNFNYCI